MSYKILCAETNLNLEDEVNKYLEDGWKLQGGLTLVRGSYKVYYMQAMVKKSA